MRKKVALDLRHRVHRHRDDNEQRRPSEVAGNVRLSAQTFRQQPVQGLLDREQALRLANDSAEDGASGLHAVGQGLRARLGAVGHGSLRA